MINEALSANMQNMFDELRVDDNTNIMDGNKELALDDKRKFIRWVTTETAVVLK